MHPLEARVGRSSPDNSKRRILAFAPHGRSSSPHRHPLTILARWSGDGERIFLLETVKKWEGSKKSNKLDIYCKCLKKLLELEGVESC